LKLIRDFENAVVKLLLAGDLGTGSGAAPLGRLGGGTSKT